MFADDIIRRRRITRKYGWSEGVKRLNGTAYTLLCAVTKSPNIKNFLFENA